MPRQRPTLVGLIDAANARRPWSHNAAYQRWVLRQVPRRPGLIAADVGCGTGELLVRLSSRCERVVGIDRDPEVAAAARTALARAALSAEVVVGDLTTLPDRGRFDVVTAVAALHHADLGTGLDRLLEALRPGGRLVVVGCYATSTPTDRLVGTLAIPANLLVGLVKAPRGRPAPASMGAPTAEATTTLSTVREEVAARDPQAHVRRRLFWRYTVVLTGANPPNPS